MNMEELHLRVVRFSLTGLFVLILATAFGRSAWAADEGIPTPLRLEGGRVVSVEDAKAMIGTTQFIDTRSALNYGRGHIAGAVLVSYHMKSERKEGADLSMDTLEIAKLPADKGAPLVFYSHGATGWKSYKAAVAALQAGYKHVLWMRDGMEAWEGKGYPTEH
jgi:rhodanese-related sulfurtransferase